MLRHPPPSELTSRFDALMGLSDRTLLQTMRHARRWPL